MPRLVLLFDTHGRHGITHTPAQGILSTSKERRECGCGELRARLETLSPKLHVFGHIHESYGRLQRNGTIHVNASISNSSYQRVNPPLVIDLDRVKD